jgi:hypothetical protein
VELTATSGKMMRTAGLTSARADQARKKTTKARPVASAENLNC